MSAAVTTLAHLDAVLPRLDELEPLRALLASRARRDPELAWDSSLAVATVDQRVVSIDAVHAALRDAEAAVHRHVERVYAALGQVISGAVADDETAAAGVLVDLAEQLRREGQARRAQTCLDAALELSLPLRDRAVQGLVLLRLGEISLILGELPAARAYYQRAATLARDSGDPASEVAGTTGLGDVCLSQGRWQQAEQRYRAALRVMDRLDDGERLLQRVKLLENLASMVMRQGRLTEAEALLAQARLALEKVDSPRDRLLTTANLARLRKLQGRTTEAFALYQHALADAAPAAAKAVVATDLADLCLRIGERAQAEEWGLTAEEYAIASQSVEVLGHTCRRRGNLARERDNEDGFAFYEKALQIARERTLPALEAETLLDYAVLRMRHGGEEEARAYVERAEQIAARTGLVLCLTRAGELREELAGIPTVDENLAALALMDG